MQIDDALSELESNDIGDSVSTSGFIKLQKKCFPLTSADSSIFFLSFADAEIFSVRILTAKGYTQF